MKLVLASRNRKKIKEMEETLTAALGESIAILSLDDIGFSDDIEENGTTFEENAVIKAAIPAKMGYIGIADDSGLAVDALAGEPGIHSARFAADEDGIGHNDERNNAKLLRLLSDLPPMQRTARFVSVIALVKPNGDSFTVRGECEGRILEQPDGDGGFGYDPLFFYEPMGKSFARMTSEEKNSISHRGVAVRKFADELKRRKFYV